MYIYKENYRDYKPPFIKRSVVHIYKYICTIRTTNPSLQKVWDICIYIYTHKENYRDTKPLFKKGLGYIYIYKENYRDSKPLF